MVQRVTIGHIKHFIVADCLDCGWILYDDDRAQARQHAADTGHQVHVTVEEVTVYKGVASS